MGPRRVQTLIFLSALLCSLAGQMESAHRIVNWDQYLKCKIAKSIKPWTSNRFDILWPKCSQISAIAAARDTSLISTSYRLPFPNESTKHIWSSKLRKLHWGHVKKICGTLVFVASHWINCLLRQLQHLEKRATMIVAYYFLAKTLQSERRKHAMHSGLSAPMHLKWRRRRPPSVSLRSSLTRVETSQVFFLQFLSLSLMVSRCSFEIYLP